MKKTTKGEAAPAGAASFETVQAKKHDQISAVRGETQIQQLDYYVYSHLTQSRLFGPFWDREDAAMIVAAMLLGGVRDRLCVLTVTRRRP